MNFLIVIGALACSLGWVFWANAHIQSFSDFLFTMASVGAGMLIMWGYLTAPEDPPEQQEPPPVDGTVVRLKEEGA